nr:photosystem II protein L [Cuscuta haughtii]WEY30209.1 photosystem II protein L [Cuscuta haughtii]
MTTIKPQRTNRGIESYQSILGVITYFCTCCFILELFFQLRIMI